MIIVGIDPGLQGGLAVLTSLNQCQLYPMPLLKTGGVDAKLLAHFLQRIKPDAIWIEQLLIVPKNSRASISVMGVNWGRIVGCIEALNIPLHIVNERDWKKGLLIQRGKGRAKHFVHERARMLFPSANFIPKGCSTFHDGITDALMIAKFGLMNTIQKR